jgi:hypothetical protein
MCMARVKIRVYFWDCVRPALSLGDHLITTAEAEREREMDNIHHTSIYSYTHTHNTKERTKRRTSVQMTIGTYGVSQRF